MKKITKILIIFILFVFYKETQSNWDLRIGGSCITILQAVSIQFEGINRDDENSINNRKFQIYNGSKFRFFYPTAGRYDTSLVQYMRHNTGGLVLASCFSETPGQGTYDIFGFGKYLIAFKPYEDTNNVMYLYLNTLDSKCGYNFGSGNVYHGDMSISYRYNSGNPYAYFNATHADDFDVYDTIWQSQGQYQEFTMWKLFYNRTSPIERNFYAKTTPFPMRPQEIEQFGLRQFILGTTVILDNCLPYGGDTAKYSYNTAYGDWPFGYYDYFYNPPIPDSVNNNLQGKTFVTPAWYYSSGTSNYRYGIKLTCLNGDSMIIKNNTRLWISGIQEINVPFDFKGDTLIFSTGSTLIKEQNAQINTCNKGCFSDSGANTVWASGSFHKAWANSEIGYYGALEHTVNNGGHIEINGNAKLKLGDNTILTFDGAGTYLKLNSASTVEFGANAKIQIKNGARIEADGCTFTASGGAGYGIVFDAPGAESFVKNSTFNNIYKPLSGRNIYSFTCNNNTFTIPSGGTGVLFQDFYVESQGQDGIAYDLNFNNNTFNNGYIGMFLGGYASDYLKANISYNTFNNTSGGWCLALRKSNCDVKNNVMTSNSNNYVMGLWLSTGKFYNNSVKNNNSQANHGSCVCFSGSYPLLAPVTAQGGQHQQQNQLMWSGGVNIFDSYHMDNFHFVGSKPVIDNGLNHFTISNSSYYHIYGVYGANDTLYQAKNNCWYGNNGNPKHYVFYCNYYPPENCSLVVVSLNKESNIQCNTPINYTGFDVYPEGGTYDTVFYSDDNRGTPAPDDEVLYSNVVQHKYYEEYFEQIISLKNLLNNYITSQYRYDALSELYTAYELLDTSNQAHRDFIFSELKNYYNSKIEQYSGDVQFVDAAYQFVLMCETKIENYNEALTGYEFIALYHPDPETRLQASMDYGEIQALLYSSGGESNQPKTINMSKILKLMDKTPIGKIIKDAYKKMENLSKDNPNTDKPQYDKRANELKDRAKFNIANSKGLSKKEREQRSEEDIRLLIKYESVQSDNFSIVPKQFSLSQNYPNPFNPVTKIAYNIPFDAKVKLVVYDILGREIVRLINDELKIAGSYTIEFNGTNLPSGVYFYRLESGNYKESKKMVLIK